MLKILREEIRLKKKSMMNVFRSTYGDIGH